MSVFFFLVICGIATLLSWRDSSSASRWCAFLLWGIPLVSFICVLALQQVRYALAGGGSAVRRAVVWLSVCLAVIAIPLHVVALRDYPFIVMGDQVRDAGLRALELYLEPSYDMFRQEWSQTLFFATWLSFLVPLWPSDVFQYRVAGAVIGLCTIFLLFLMSVRWAGVIAAVVAACFASCNLAHLFFARTEPLISCSELLSVVAFATSIHVWNAEGVQVRRGFALLGLLVGLSFLLHASARAPAIVALGIGLWGFTWRRRERGRDAVLGGAQMLALASLLAVAAAGPYLVKLTWYYLSTPGSASAVRGVPLYELIEAICARYLKTLELLWGAPLALHFQGQPLISRTTAVVVFVGVVSSLVRRQGAGLACIVFVALVLLANSAVAPEVNAGHRVLAALPAICLLAGLGVAVLVDVVKRVGRRYWVASIVVPVLCLMPAFVNTALFFFLDEAAQVETSRSRRMLYSSLRHIVESSEVRTRIYSFKTLCLYSKEGSWLADELRMLHVIDFFKFFLPKHNYQSQVSRNIEDPDSVIVAPGCKEFDPGRIKRWTFDCTGRPVWVCPGPEKQTPVYLME